jgi:hypothetical protein
MNVIFVKYEGNLTASRLVLRPRLSKIGSVMIHIVMYVANTKRIIPSAKGGRKGDVTKRFSGSKSG